MLKEQTAGWNNAYLDQERMAYPAEYVIRIFRGSYPYLNLARGGYEGKSILDVGCGDGRHLCFFKTLGFNTIAGTEISEETVSIVKQRMTDLGVDADIRVGINNALGFEDEQFDYMLSWNVCYYLDDEMDFSSHVKEYARVLKRGGVLVFSIPFKDCFVYKDGIEKDGFMTIKDDWFKIRNGSVQKIFQDEDDIKREFGNHFDDFVFGRITDDCFGLDYRWYIGCCKKI